MAMILVKVKNLKKGDYFKFTENSLPEIARKNGWTVNDKVHIITWERIFSEKEDDKMLTAILNDRAVLISDYHFLWEMEVEVISRDNNVDKYRWTRRI